MDSIYYISQIIYESILEVGPEEMTEGGEESLWALFIIQVLQLPFLAFKEARKQLVQQFYQSRSFVHNEVLLFVSGSVVPSPLRGKKPPETSENGEDKVKACLV